MHISFSSLLMSLLFGNIFTGIMILILKKNKIISRFHINFMVICLLLIMMRFALPIELNFSKSIACKIFLPDMRQLLELPLGKSKISFLSILLIVWGMVACLKLIIFLIPYIRIRLLIGSYERCQDNNVNEILNDICRKRSCKNRFTVIKIKDSQSPFIFGLIHPIIILPQMKLSDQELKIILNHETEHFFNHDLWNKYLMEVMCIVYWWNPFIYSLKKELDKVLELRSDAFITEKLDVYKKIEYLECLIKIAKMNYCHKNLRQSLAFCRENTVSNLEQRFEFILEDHGCGKKYNKYLCLLVSGMILLTSFSFIFEPYSISKQVEVSTLTLSPENAYILEKGDQYYICVYGKSAVIIDEIYDSFADLPVYKEDKK